VGGITSGQSEIRAEMGQHPRSGLRDALRLPLGAIARHLSDSHIEEQHSSAIAASCPNAEKRNAALPPTRPRGPGPTLAKPTVWFGEGRLRSGAILRRQSDHAI
jgi:hypothetical protein